MNSVAFQDAYLLRALDGLSARHRVVATNLANESTPGYQRRELKFEDQLETASRGGSFDPEVVVDRRPGDSDGNNVVAEEEIGTLNRIEVTYQVLSRALSHEAALTRLALTGR